MYYDPVSDVQVLMNPQTDQKVTLPATDWASLERLCPFLREIVGGNRSPEAIDRFLSHMRSLEVVRHPLQYKPHDDVTPESRLSMAKALFIFSNLPRLCSDRIGGTYHSASLQSFSLLKLPDCIQLERLSLTPEQEIEFAQWKDETLGLLRQTLEILGALSSRFSGLNRPDDISSFLKAMFGSCPVPAEELKAIVTSAMFTVIVDFVPGTGELRNRRAWDALTPEQRSEIKKFNLAQQQFAFRRYSNFPSYGLVNEVDAALLEAISNETGYGQELVAQIIAQSVNFLPACDAEYFLVHDTWGHGPDRVNPYIRRDFDEIARLHETSAIDQPVCINGTQETLADLLNSNASSEQVLEVFHALARKRLGVMMVNVICEHAAVARESAGALGKTNPAANPPTSSILGSGYVSKIDFEGADLMDAHKFMVGRMIDQLLEWCETNPLDTNDSIVQILVNEYRQFYDPSGPFRPNDDFSQAFANLVLLQNSLQDIFNSEEAKHFGSLGMLASLFVTCYCSGDMGARFWTVDNRLASDFLPLWNQLIQ